MNKEAPVTLTVLQCLPPQLKLKVQLSYNAFLYEAKKLVAEHGPMALLALGYLGDQIHDIEQLQVEDLANLPFEHLELL